MHSQVATNAEALRLICRADAAPAAARGLALAMVAGSAFWIAVAAAMLA